MHEALMLRTFEVLEYLVTQHEESPAKGSSREAEDLLLYPSRATGMRKKMHVDTVALTQGLEDGIKACTIHLLLMSGRLVTDQRACRATESWLPRTYLRRSTCGLSVQHCTSITQSAVDLSIGNKAWVGSEIKGKNMEKNS